jgi:RNA polymerase sigma-70 factor (ECF subfamily)
MDVDRRVRFELLYGRHAPAVKAYVMRRASAALADDVVAEVFVVCWRRFEEVPAEPLPWLLGVARKVLSTQRRGEQRREALAERLQRDCDPAAVVLQTSEDGVLADALAQLSEDDRELLMLIAWDGMTPSGAAAVLGIKPATARVRLMRARRRLTHALERGEQTPVLCSPLSMEVPS